MSGRLEAARALPRGKAPRAPQCFLWRRKERNGVVAVALLVVDARLYAFVIVGFVRCSSRHLAFLLVIHPLFYQVQFERH